MKCETCGLRPAQVFLTRMPGMCVPCAREFRVPRDSGIELAERDALAQAIQDHTILERAADEAALREWLRELKGEPQGISILDM